MRNTDDNGNAMLPKKSSNFKDTRHKIYAPLAIDFFFKVPNFIKKTKKNIPGQMLRQDRPEKNSAKCLIRRSEIASPRQTTSIDKTAVVSERGALVRGSDPPSGRSVHKTAGDTMRARARRLIQKLSSTGV